MPIGCHSFQYLMYDCIYGGTGNDGLYGGEGNDYIEGRGGNDYISGDAGNDTGCETFHLNKNQDSSRYTCRCY